MNAVFLAGKEKPKSAHTHDAALTTAPREQGEVEGESPVSVAFTLTLTINSVSNRTGV